jgi:lantibiotic modifying enzyme
MLRQTGNRELRSDIDKAVQATFLHGFGKNHSLCHGDLGNLEFLIQVSDFTEDELLRGEVDGISQAILHNILQDGRLCGVPLGVETPGLMTGLAGIGYELLRLAYPSHIPSVLLLEPPRFTSKDAVGK